MCDIYWLKLIFKYILIVQEKQFFKVSNGCEKRIKMNFKFSVNKISDIDNLITSLL